MAANYPALDSVHSIGSTLACAWNPGEPDGRRGLMLIRTARKYRAGQHDNADDPPNSPDQTSRDEWLFAT
jgi:hypothetical protein